MTRFFRLFRCAWVLVAGCGLVLQAGCDGGGGKRASQYSTLVGTWRVQQIETGGVERSLRDTVQLEFFAEEGRGRFYRLLRPGRQNVVVAEGAVEVLNSDMLSMTEGFAAPLLWSFDFEEPNDLTTSVRFVLESRWEGSSEAFLSVIGISGSARPLRLDLVRDGE